MYKLLFVIVIALIQIHIAYAAEITKDKQAVLDNYCFKLHSMIQDEHIFASTNTDPTLAREKLQDQADSAQYEKVCGKL